jgi:hypothetical protein
MRERTVTTAGRERLLDVLKLIGISGRDTTEAYSNLGLTTLKYSTQTLPGGKAVNY